MSDDRQADGADRHDVNAVGFEKAQMPKLHSSSASWTKRLRPSGLFSFVFAKKFKIDRSDRIVAAPALFLVQPVQERECSVSESVGRSVLFPSHLRA